MRLDLTNEGNNNTRMWGITSNYGPIFIERASGVTTGVGSYTSGATFTATIGSGNNKDPIGIAFGFDVSGMALCANGGTVATNAGVLAGQSVNYLARANTSTATEYADGFYDFVGISPERLSNAQLQALAVAA